MADKGKLHFIISRVESKRFTGNRKKDVASIASIYWCEIIRNHVFTDGNKRTATETMKLFLKMNGVEIEAPYNGLIYISLKIANGDMKYPEVVSWLHGRIREVKK
ncbi:MAG: type II toxin-antitoxin system death-on-curing family toxin [Candidatus Aenigmarchaeota archaeon]|nr:type II toxin-antitoxin system death-on-curing family toxin [Candidatus Aenigmarchaeota archaeon]